MQGVRGAGHSSKHTTAGEKAKEAFKYGEIGGFAGYNFDLGGDWVAGVEGDVKYGIVQKSKGKNGFGAKARLRGGYATDDALGYVAIGYGTGTGIKTPTAEANNLKGMTYAAGVDYKISDNVFTRAEYEFQPAKGTLKSGGKSAGSVSEKSHTISVGLGVKF